MTRPLSLLTGLLPGALVLVTLGCTGDGDGETDGTSASTGATTDAPTTDAPTTAGSADPTGDPTGNPTGDATTDATTAGTDSNGESTGEVIPTEKFSFFVTSLIALQELSGSQEGFGGDLRFGEDGPGAGLRGADKICATIAEKSMPGAGNKQWRAFLSAVSDENGNQVNAIDRVGEGPWYDRLGRTFALTKADLLTERPTNIDPAIKDDFPNEDGVPNHQPDPNQPEVDNHDTLTGTNENGQLYSKTATCADWTGNTGSEGKPRVGHSWPRYGMGGPGPGPGPGMGDGSMANWMSSLDESGCAPGVSLIEMGPPDPNSNTVGSGGGYGGFYCFALTP
ncbi:hypothetical protein [Nannocystis sp.]|uniref:hypothetical protein n=1 Tax=Nannocystis sp. TaxID=1962667 RepID=UPI0025CF720F|nr:hypothetical protein [Nannocystis sp.]